jgi:competence protein ComEA
MAWYRRQVRLPQHMRAALCALTLALPTARAHAESPDALPAEAASVDLNRASAQELEALPGIGAAKASAILAYRDKHGGFRHVNELMKIRGIGRKMLGKLRPRVWVGDLASREGRHPVR